MSADESQMPAAGGKRHFATTQWSVVLAAGDIAGHEGRIALAQLCETYWYPLYAYVRRRVENVHDAQDLIQAFFSHLLERRAIARADRNRGRFRSFLVTSLKNFLANEWDKARAEKRGGVKAELSLDFDSGESRYQFEPSHELTPEKLYERRWVLTLLNLVMGRLQGEYEASGRAGQFERLKGTLTGDRGRPRYAALAAEPGMSEEAARQAASRLPKRYRELLREEVARTLSLSPMRQRDPQRLAGRALPQVLGAGGVGEPAAVARSQGPADGALVPRRDVRLRPAHGRGVGGPISATGNPRTARPRRHGRGL